MLLCELVMYHVVLEALAHSVQTADIYNRSTRLFRSRYAGV
jgi:hypothetical protein